jgi:hypothetical protein
VNWLSQALVAMWKIVLIFLEATRIDTDMVDEDLPEESYSKTLQL